MKIYDRVLKSAVRYVYQTRKDASITEYMMLFHLLPARVRPKFKLLTFVKKALLAQTPGYISDIIPKRKWPEKYLRKNEDDFLVGNEEMLRGRMSNRAFSYAASEFNNLSYQTRSCSDIVKFKSLLKTELFINAYQI